MPVIPPNEPAPSPTTATPKVTWLSEHVDITRGFLLACIAVAFAFVGFAIWGAVYVVNDLRLQDCEAVNTRRSEASEVAKADVAADRQIWEAIDKLFVDGIPEPARTIIFDSLQQRDQLIHVVYGRQMCA